MIFLRDSLSQLAEPSKVFLRTYQSYGGQIAEVTDGWLKYNVDNNLHKFWENSGNSAFWFFYQTKAMVNCLNIGANGYSKSNDGIAFFSAAKVQNQGSQIWVYPNFISTDENAKEFNGASSQAYRKTITRNGDTWYCLGNSHGAEWSTGMTISPNGVLISEGIYARDSGGYSDQIFNDMLDKIYANDFAENYQLQRYYNLNVANIETTLRKAFAIFLYKNVGAKSWASYQALMNGMETFIGYVNGEKGNNDKMGISFAIGSDTRIIAVVYYSNGSTINKQVTVDDASGGYDYYRYFDYLTYNSYTRVIYDANGNATHNYASYTGNLTNTIGVLVSTHTVNNVQVNDVFLSNTGITF